MFWNNKNEADETQRLYERELAKKDKRIAYLESRIRGIQHQGILDTCTDEVLYVIQQPNGRFAKFMLPWVR